VKEGNDEMADNLSEIHPDYSRRLDKIATSKGGKMLSFVQLIKSKREALFIPPSIYRYFIHFLVRGRVVFFLSKHQEVQDQWRSSSRL